MEGNEPRVRPDKTPPSQSAAESVYSKREIMAAARSFGVSVDVMAGAMRLVDKDQLTKVEVEKAIQNFKKRQV